MGLTEDKQYMQRLAEEISALCREIQACSREVEKAVQGRRLREHLMMLCREGAEVIRGVDDVSLLMALMDAYEITQDEGMLQAVLDVVSPEVGRLEASAEHVRLLSYCYYYTEDEECADLAREMLRTLRGRGNAGEIGRAEQIYHELVEENHSAG